MVKCLVTKLNGSVDNNELLRIGEMRVKVESVESPTKDTQGFGIASVEPITVEIVGDGYFTDETLTENKGKSMVVTGTQGIIVSQATTVAIRNKYNLSALRIFIPSGSPYGKNKIFNLDDFKYSPLKDLNLAKSQTTGDIASLENLTNLTNFFANGTNISGDIANLKNLSALRSLNVSNTKVIGDIANLKNLTGLGELSISDTNISGDIANLKNITALRSLNFYNSKVSGDLQNIYFILNGNTKTLNISLCDYLYGDLASLPNNILHINNFSGKSKFTWKKGSTRTNVLACTYIYCSNIDDMLNDMANMSASFASNETISKTISLIGTRTSASDAAVQTLQSKGYTVSITPA